ncbi:MAG: tetratricopeptide repeat protein [Agriterribacter sp.]
MERIETLLNFLKKDPADSFVQHALALEYIKQEDDEKALTLFEDILTRDPAYTGSYYHLAKLLERKGDIPAALQWYEKGMEMTKVSGDRKAYNELLSGYEEISGD